MFISFFMSCRIRCGLRCLCYTWGRFHKLIYAPRPAVCALQSTWCYLFPDLMWKSDNIAKKMWKLTIPFPKFEFLNIKEPYLKQARSKHLGPNLKINNGIQITVHSKPVFSKKPDNWIVQPSECWFGIQIPFEYQTTSTIKLWRCYNYKICGQTQRYFKNSRVHKNPWIYEPFNSGIWIDRNSNVPIIECSIIKVIACNSN